MVGRSNPHGRLGQVDATVAPRFAGAQVAYEPISAMAPRR